MIIFTQKLTRKSLSVIILVLGALLCLVIVAVSDARGGYPKYGKAETEEDRKAFVRSFGWEIPDGPPEIKEVTIPREFDDVYMRYNLIQKAQGLDLLDFAGVTVKQYTYPIENYPTGEQNVMIHLLAYEGKVIGGDVMSPRLDGFMHGFEYPG